jgi:hypothetical protein
LRKRHVASRCYKDGGALVDIVLVRVLVVQRQTIR